MPIEIVEADFAIAFFERVHGFDFTRVFEGSEVHITSAVRDELVKGYTYRPLPFQVFEADFDEEEACSKLRGDLQRLGRGE